MIEGKLLNNIITDFQDKLYYHFDSTGELHINAEVKEPILIEETKVEQVMVPNKRNVVTSEIVTDTSDH